jgi:hypothetical protein
MEIKMRSKKKKKETKEKNTGFLISNQKPPLMCITREGRP